MFDIATRPNPLLGASAAAVPFDWRLTPPTEVLPFPWTDYSTPGNAVESGVAHLQTFALALEDTLQTAIYLSLFTDRRAGVDDKPPRGAVSRRGWVGDEFVSPRDPWGSRLWLLRSGKSTDDVLEKARFMAQESLDWMVREGVASKVEVQALWVGGTQGSRLAIRPQIFQPEQSSPVYDVLWALSVEKGTSV